MKIMQGLFFSLAGLLVSGSAFAQTCAAPAVWQPRSQWVGVPVSGTTCGHETGLVSICSGGQGMPGQAYVARLTTDGAAVFSQITFTGGAGYTISAYLVPVAEGCVNDAACTTVGDGTTPILHSDIPPGDYFLMISGADFDAPGACGSFVVAIDGNLPVALKRFTVE